MSEKEKIYPLENSQKVGHLKSKASEISQQVGHLRSFAPEIRSSAPENPEISSSAVYSRNMENQFLQLNKTLKNKIKITKNDVLKSIMSEELKLISDKNGESSSALLSGIIKDTPIFGKAYYNSISQKMEEPCSEEMGMEYEKMIYEELVPKLSLYSPNFLQPISSVTITPKDLNSRAKRLIYKRLKESIPISEGCKPNNSISIIFTQLVKHTTLYDISKDKTISSIDFQKIFAQIILSLAAMSLHNLSHNDLHSDNIMIEKLDKPETFQYFFENSQRHSRESSGIFLTIPNVEYKVYIFDWDFSYYPPFGNNMKTEIGEYCKDYGVCNKYDQLFDLYNIMCYCYNNFSGKKPFLTSGAPSMTNKLGNLMSGAPSMTNKLGNLRREGRFSREQDFNKFMQDITGKTHEEIIEINKKLVRYNYKCHLPSIEIKTGKKSRNEIFGKEIFVDEMESPLEMFLKIIQHSYIKNVLME